MKSDSQHWNRIFRETTDEQLGWYESDPANTLRLLNRIPGWKHSSIFLPGVGTSVLVDALLETQARLTLNDISREALDHDKEREGDRAADIEWVCQDIALPLSNRVLPLDIWIDRAVLHFLTEEVDIQGYFRNVLSRVKIGGHALFAEFPPHGASKCAGLDVHRYSTEELSDRLGSGFSLVDHFDHTYITPAGDPRPYIYALFKREQ